MKVHELIVKLQALPQDALVLKESYNSSFCECDDDGLPIIDEVWGASWYADAPYPSREKNVVVL